MGNIQATANEQYPTMSNEDICKLRVADIADDIRKFIIKKYTKLWKL